MPLGANILPWLQGKELARLQRMLDYFLLNSQIDRSQRYLLAVAPWRPVHRPGSHALAAKVQPVFISLGVMVGSNSTEKAASRRSLVTGQELPKEPGERMLKHSKGGGELWRMFY